MRKQKLLNRALQNAEQLKTCTQRSNDLYEELKETQQTLAQYRESIDGYTTELEKRRCMLAANGDTIRELQAANARQRDLLEATNKSMRWKEDKIRHQCAAIDHLEKQLDTMGAVNAAPTAIIMRILLPLSDIPSGALITKKTGTKRYNVIHDISVYGPETPKRLVIDSDRYTYLIDEEQKALNYHGSDKEVVWLVRQNEADIVADLLGIEPRDDSAKLGMHNETPDDFDPEA